MTTKIYSQSECNYRHIQDMIAMMPAATRDLDQDAKPDTMRALAAATTAVTGANGHLFLGVAEVDGVTAGFMVGAVAQYLLESRLLAQDVLLYVAPDQRGGGIAGELINTFCEWAKAKGASEVRMFLMGMTSETVLGPATSALGFANAGTVKTLKLGGE